MGKRFIVNLQTSLESTCKYRISKISNRCQNWEVLQQLLILNSEMNLNFFPIMGVHSTTSDPELRNDKFTLISFMGFPAILSALQPFQICICNSKNRKFPFSNDPQLMRKGFMANLHATLDSTCKSRISKIFTRFQNLGDSFHNFWSWTQKWKITLISFIGFPAILGTLQPFWIYICNRKNGNLTFSNGSQLMGKRFMANLHTSLDSTYKSRISKISTRCQNWGGLPQL